MLIRTKKFFSLVKKHTDKFTAASKHRYYFYICKILDLHSYPFNYLILVLVSHVKITTSCFSFYLFFYPLQPDRMKLDHVKNLRLKHTFLEVSSNYLG